MRRRLPDRRDNETWEVEVGGAQVLLTAGMHPDGELGEVFLIVGTGDVRRWADDWGMAVSLALQHGCSLATLIDLYVHSCSNPNGQVIGHDKIRQCSSVADFVVRALGLRFLGREDLACTNGYLSPSPL